MATDVEDSEMEGSPEFKHALKMVLKRQMKDLINQICEQGIEIAVMEVNINDGSTSHFGTPIGESFIAEQKSLTHSFASFCKTNGRISADVPSDRSPRRRVEKKITPMSKSRPSTSTDPPTLRITVPRRLSVGISEQELGGLVGRIVASQLDKNKEKGDGSSGGTKFDALLESVKAKEKPLNVTRSGRKVSNKFLEGLKSSKKSIKAEESESGDEGSSEKLIGRLSDLETQAMKKVQVKTGDGKSVDVQKTTLVQGDQLESLAAAIIKELQRVPNIADRKQVKVTLEQTDENEDITLDYEDDEETEAGLMDDSDMEYDDFKDNLAEYDEDDDFADEVDESMDANDASVEKSDSMNDKKSRMSQVEMLDCPTCGKQVKGKWGLAKHMQVHIKSDSPRTPKHRKPRIKKRGLSETMPMTCEHCGKVVRGKWGLRTHINRMHIGIKDHPCQICPMQFYGRTALESHKLMVHTKRCTKCKRYIEESEPWTEDIDRFCTRNVTCLCGAVLIFSSKKNVDVGGSESELENLNDTEDVGEISDVKKELEKSILDDNEQNKQEEIAKKIKKIKDRKKQIASEITPLECTHCGQFLKGKNTLKQHIERVHLKIREHPCQICPKEFFTESDLDHHTLTVHTRKCIKCQGYVVESVPWTEGTDRFMKRDVLCACGEIVSFFSDIGPKRKIDDNEEDDGAKKMKRSYECEKCGKFFDRPTKLETHVKTHESNKQCHLCSVKFSDKASCEKHMKEAHSLVMLKCKVCKFQFSNADSLKVHYMKMHRNYLSDKGIETMLDAELDLGACEQAGQDESLASNISSILEQNQLNNSEIPLPPMVSRIDKLEQDLKPGQTMISQVDGGFIYVATKDPDLTNDGAREFVQEAIREGHVTVNSDEISIILKQLC